MPPRRPSFKEDFFAYDNEKSFYWAGMLAADGCLTDRIVIRKDGITQSHIKAVQFGLNDQDIVSAFLKDIDLCTKILEKRSLRLRGEVIFYYFKVHSEQMFNDLMRFGLTPRKSKTLEMPKWLQNHPLVNHFIRGYFDGDGSASYHRKSKRFSIAGTRMFLEAVERIFKNNVTCKIKAKIYEDTGCSKIQYDGINIVSEVSSFIYKDATIWMERKRKILESTMGNVICS